MSRPPSTILIIALAALASGACQDRKSPEKIVGGIGDPCDSPYDCQTSLVCAHSGTCQDPGERPRGLAAEGESCDSSSCADPEGCPETTCRYGLTCCSTALGVSTGCTVRTCVAPGSEGDRCEGTEDCELGLVCDEDGLCAPDGVSRLDNPCALSSECIYGLVCGSEGTCKEPGEGDEGETCEGHEDCLDGLVCAGDGTCRDPEDPDAPSHGVAALGEACAATADCQSGMTCFLDGTCQLPRYWPGAWCAPDDEAEPFKVYFEIPSLPASDELDFYRLPFPNDIRIRGGKVQLDGHPVPDVDVARDVVRDYIDAIDDKATGFSTQPTVYMRFSHSPEFGTIRLASTCETCEVPSESPPDCPSGCAQWLLRNFYIVNITPPADPADPAYAGYGEGLSFGMSVTTGRGRYICQNNIALRPADGSPLRPGATYAVIVTDTANPAEGVRTADGETLVQDNDFAKLVEGISSGNCADAADGDPDIETACRLPGYGWLADYLDDETQIDYDPAWAAHLKGATVFTTARPAEGFATFRDKINACSGSDCSNLPAPTPEGFTENAALGGTGFTVFDGAVRMPIFQQGTPPYATMEEGGAISYAADGTVEIAGTPSSDFHRVALSLSVPDSTDVPAGGWPVVVYVHDVEAEPSGDAFHAYIRNGVAASLASVEVELGDPPTAQTARMAVLSIEGVMHGGRTGLLVERSPAALYHNLLNPYAVRDNVIQAAADGFQILRFIQAVHEIFAEGGSYPGLEGVDLDPDHVYLLGHGEGARSALVFAAFEPLVKALAVTQAGGPLSAVYTTQRAPLDFAGSMAVMVAERSPGTMHPVVSLMQMIFDPADPVNYGRFIINQPPQVGETTDDPPVPILAGPHHLFMVMGRNDPAAPEGPMFSLIATLGIHQVDNDAAGCRCGEACDAPDAAGLHDAVCTIGGLTAFTDDARGNLLWGAVTGAVTMALPGSGDSGRDVIFEDADAAAQYAGFFASAFLDPEGIPTVYAP
jgi:hypothetical protein